MCNYTGNNYIIMLKKSLSVPKINNNLVPIFAMREAGLKVNSTPKINSE